MQPQQIPQLLAEIAMADHRVRREDPIEQRAQVHMWAGILAEVPYDFAVRAAQQHYAASPFAILPSDIAARWTSTVRDRMGRHTDPTPAADPDDELAYRRQLRETRQAVASGQVAPAPQAIAAGPPAGIRELTAGIGRTVPKRDEEQPYVPEHARQALAEAGFGKRMADRPELAIPCPVPTCRALERRACKTPSGREMHAGSHPSRLDAWSAQGVNAAEAAR